MRLKSFSILIINLIFLCGFVFAQSPVKIEGTVFSNQGKPLQGANIIVIGTGTGTTTDANGHFSIENLFSGEYTVQVRYVGYEPQAKDIVVRKDLITPLYFTLKPVIIDLQEIAVQANRERPIPNDFIEIVTRKEIEKSSARTVGELLKYIPGITLIDEAGGGGRKRLSIRGSQSNQVLVVLDGVELNDPLTGDTDLHQIPLSGIQEIKVHKGGNSSLYGSGAMGGVVEIISRNNPLEQISASARNGQYHVMGVKSVLAGRTGSLSWFFTYDKNKEKGDYDYTYQRPDGTNVNATRQNAGFESQNVFAKLLYDFDHHEIQIQTHLYRSTRGLPGLVFSWTPYAKADTDRHLFLSRYAYQKGPRHHRISLSHYENNVEFQNQPPKDAPLRYRTVPPYHTRYRVHSLHGSAESRYTLGDERQLCLRTGFQKDDFHDKNVLTNTMGPVNQTENLGAFASLKTEWHLPKPEFLSRITLSPAVRWDHFILHQQTFTRKYQQTSPRIGLLISRYENWLLALRAHWGKSFKTPTFADLFYQDFRVRGNADLLPEKSSDRDIGLKTGLPFLGWLELDATFFHHRIEDLIVWEMGSFATWRPSNTDALLQGWDLSGSWQTWKKQLHITFSHTWLDARDKSDRRTTRDKRLVYRPEHTTKIGLELELDPLNLSYHRHGVGSRFVTPSNTVSQPGYTVDDVSVSVRHCWKELEGTLKFSVFNLYDKSYEIIEHAPLPGRHWRAEYKIAY
jgi:outer membrane cobalamin receptor